MTNAPPPPPDDTAPMLRRLGRWRLAARAVLLFEYVWPAIWPALGVAGAFVCAALLDLPSMLPGGLHAALLVAVGLGVAGLLARGLMRLRMPADADADRRLEQRSGLRHRPFTALTDRPAAAGGEVLWQAHVARAAAQIGRLRVGWPRPGLAARDRRALRGALVVGLVACWGIAGQDAWPRLHAALRPHFTPATPAPATQLQAWVTPPGYTGLAPLLLKVDDPQVSVPAGSQVTVSLTGGPIDAEVPALSLGGKVQPFAMLDQTSFQAQAELNAGGHLGVLRHGRELAGWDLAVVADAAPVVSFPEPPGLARFTRPPQVRLPWQVAHRYGVVSLQAELRLRDRPTAPALIVPIPLPGGAPKSAKGVRLQDLTPHPWAGLPVVARLVARDAAGQTGTSAEAGFDLPERLFQNPVAARLMAVRKMLTVQPDDRMPAIYEMNRLSALDDVWRNDLGAFLNLRSIASLLYRDRTLGAVDVAQERLWQLALHLEEGAVERTARTLDQARQALRDLMDAEKRGEKVDPAELNRRMQDLQTALDKHLQALAEQARRDPQQDPDPDARQLDARDMERLAQEMHDAARDGRMDEARDKMAELDRMLQELQNARPGQSQPSERQRQRAEKRQRGQQQMSALQDMVQRQGKLLDRAQSRSSQSAPPPAPGAQPAQPEQQHADQPSPDASQRTADARVQQALRRALGELMQQYGDLTGKVPPNLGDADSAMRDAGQALAQGRDPAAAGAQQRALEALQKGGDAMSEQMARQFGRPGQQPGDADGDQDGQGGETADGGNPGDQPGGDRWGPNGRSGDRPWDSRRSAERRSGQRRDPLGRPMQDGTSGTDESSDVQVPDQMEEARSRAIQEELRRRGAERSRPQPELDYIDRLLRQF